MHKNNRRLASVVAALALAGCGGGSDATAPTTVSGSVVKGPVSGSQVCAYAATASGKGTQLGCTTTAANGSYSLQIVATGDLIIEATGGTYTDEATSTTRTLSDPMQVVLGASAGGTVTGVVTPLTSVAYTVSRGRSGGPTAVNFGASLTQVATSFGMPGVNLAGTVPSVSGTLNDYGRMLRAISQFIANGGTLAHLQSGATPTELQAALETAYAAINGSGITLNLANLGSTPTDTGGSTGGGSGSLKVSFAVNGGPSIPPVTIPGVPIPPAGTFCSSLNAANAQLAALAAVGTVSINGCNASGNTYTVNVSVQPQGAPAPLAYTVTYAFS